MKKEIDMFGTIAKYLQFNVTLGMIIGLGLFIQPFSYAAPIDATCTFLSKNSAGDYTCNHFKSKGWSSAGCHRCAWPPQGEEYITYFQSPSYDTLNQCQNECYSRQKKDCQVRYLESSGTC